MIEDVEMKLEKTEQEDMELATSADQLTSYLCRILVMYAPALKSLCKDPEAYFLHIAISFIMNSL